MAWHPSKDKTYRIFNIPDHVRGVYCTVKANWKGLVYPARFRLVENGDEVSVKLFAPSSERLVMSDKDLEGFMRLQLPVSFVKFSKKVKHVDTIRTLGQSGERFKTIDYVITLPYPFDRWTRYEDLTKSPRNQINRRRGGAIIERPEGVLVVAGNSGKYLLPGGGAHKGESRMDAAIRELKEETGLVAKSCKFLFSHEDGVERKIRNFHKVFLIEADGRPHHVSSESSHIAYWKPDDGSSLNISPTTKLLIEKYYSEFKTSDASESSSKTFRKNINSES